MTNPGMWFCSPMAAPACGRARQYPTTLVTCRSSCNHPLSPLCHGRPRQQPRPQPPSRMQLRQQETLIWLIPLAEEAASTEEVLLKDEAVQEMKVASGGDCVGKGGSAGGKYDSWFFFFWKKKKNKSSLCHPSTAVMLLLHTWCPALRTTPLSPSSSTSCPHHSCPCHSRWCCSCPGPGCGCRLH